jgi:outer membrane protein assembly factor BamB
MSGKEVWRKETGKEPPFATSTSPLVVDGKCIVFVAELSAFDTSTGDVKWKGPAGAPYGSPTLMMEDKTQFLVTPTANSLVGVNLEDGKVLWQVKLPGSGYTVNYGTPIVDGQTVIYNAPARGGSGTSFAVKIEKKGDGFTATELWKSKAAYQYNTPVLKDGLLFGLSAEKKFFCMDAKTGKVLWTDTTARGEAGGVLNAGSVILAVTGPAAMGGGGGGRGRGGMGRETAQGDAALTVFEASGTGYKELAQYKLSPGPGLADPVLAGNRVYVKGNNALTLWTMD